MAYQINSEWQEASLLTGFPIGQQLSIQNAGRAGDIIEIIVSDTKPIEGQRSYVIRSIDPLYRVSGQSSEVWIRYIRYDLNGTITPQPARTCLANITDNEQISEASALPVDLYTKPGPDKRVKVSVQDQAETGTTNAQLQEVIALLKAIAMGIEMIADQEEGTLLQDINEE